MQEAEAAERGADPMLATCRAIVETVIEKGIEAADRKRTWKGDAAEALRRGQLHPVQPLLKQSCVIECMRLQMTAWHIGWQSLALVLAALLCAATCCSMTAASVIRQRGDCASHLCACPGGLSWQEEHLACGSPPGARAWRPRRPGQPVACSHKELSGGAPYSRGICIYLTSSLEAQLDPMR